MNTTTAELPLMLPLWPSERAPDEPALAPILRMSRSKAFDLAKRGEFPIPLVRYGRRYLGSRANLLRYLGETPPEAA